MRRTKGVMRKKGIIKRTRSMKMKINMEMMDMKRIYYRIIIIMKVNIVIL